MKAESRSTCPQFFKNNLPVVNLCSRLINLETSHQYQREERTLIKRRFNVAPTRINRLRESMCEDRISSDEQLSSLKSDLEKFHQDDRFSQCRTMGEIHLLKHCHSYWILKTKHQFVCFQS
jgi:hypothetical protein